MSIRQVDKLFLSPTKNRNQIETFHTDLII
jgi:hypothetical protein